MIHDDEIEEYFQLMYTSIYDSCLHIMKCISLFNNTLWSIHIQDENLTYIPLKGGIQYW